MQIKQLTNHLAPEILLVIHFPVLGGSPGLMYLSAHARGKQGNPKCAEIFGTTKLRNPRERKAEDFLDFLDFVVVEGTKSDSGKNKEERRVETKHSGNQPLLRDNASWNSSTEGT